LESQPPRREPVDANFYDIRYFLRNSGIKKATPFLKFFRCDLACSEVLGNAQFMLRTDANFGKGLRAIFGKI
jgi:hypothetical protein